MNPVLWGVFGYLSGTLPTAYWMGRALKGIDIRTVGSGNVGATNVFRSVGRGAGIATLLIDMGKGLVPVLLAERFGPGGALPLAVAMAAVIGHTASPWIGFRGGKGVATSAGVFLALLPGATGLALAAFAVGLALSRRVSVGSLLAAVVLPSTAWGLGAPPDRVALALGVAVFVVVKHRANMKRLWEGTEPPLQFSRTEKRNEP